MSTLVHCPSCRANLRINSEKLASLLRCPKCKKNFRLRAANATHSAPPAVTKSAPKAAARMPGSPATVRRAPRPPADDGNDTILGQNVSPSASTLPSYGNAPPMAASRGKGGLLLWVFLGCLLTSLLGGGGFAAYYFFWKSPANNASKPEDRGASNVNADFGKWGVIEIGSKGIKTLVLDVFQAEDKENYDFNVVWQADANPTLVATGADELAFAPQALDAAESQLRRFHATIRDKHGVGQERIFVVSSSGLWVPFAKNADALMKNKKALAERVKAATDLPLHHISAVDEARLGMKTCVPRTDLPVAVFLDIGSGNIKGGYFESRDVFEGTDVPLGSVTYAKKVKAESKLTGKPFLEQAAELRPASLEQPLREQIDRTPGLARLPKVHLAGGAVWALATFTHPTDRKPRLELTAADIERFAVLVCKPEDAVRNEVLAQVKDPEQFKKMQKEIGRVQKKFRPENLQAAAEILKALSNVYNFKDKRLFFFRNSYVAWPMGFVLERSKIRE